MKAIMNVSIGIFLSCAGSVCAEEPRPAPSGDNVQRWMDMQRSGEQASATPQTLTPVIQERVVKRYLDSFNAPIPVFFLDAEKSRNNAR